LKDEGGCVGSIVTKFRRGAGAALLRWRYLSRLSSGCVGLGRSGRQELQVEAGAENIYFKILTCSTVLQQLQVRTA
jgi:hypothetical protein